MSKVQQTINQIINEARPSNYDNVSYNTYFNNLTRISNVHMEEKAALKTEVLKIQDESIRLKLLELL